METASEQDLGFPVSLGCERRQGADLPVHPHLPPTHSAHQSREDPWKTSGPTNFIDKVATWEDGHDDTLREACRNYLCLLSFSHATYIY